MPQFIACPNTKCSRTGFEVVNGCADLKTNQCKFCGSNTRNSNRELLMLPMGWTTKTIVYSVCHQMAKTQVDKELRAPGCTMSKSQLKKFTNKRINEVTDQLMAEYKITA